MAGMSTSKAKLSVDEIMADYVALDVVRFTASDLRSEGFLTQLYGKDSPAPRLFSCGVVWGGGRLFRSTKSKRSMAEAHTIQLNSDGGQASLPNAPQPHTGVWSRMRAFDKSVSPATNATILSLSRPRTVCNCGHDSLCDSPLSVSSSAIPSSSLAQLRFPSPYKP